MLGVIMALWWWYAIFLERVCPPERPFYYCFAFICMTSVALSAKLWDNVILWIAVSMISLLLLLVRFALVAHYAWMAEQFPRFSKCIDQPRAMRKYASRRFIASDGHILSWAFRILFMCFIVGMLIIVGMYAASNNDFIERMTTESLPLVLYTTPVMAGVLYTLVVAIYTSEPPHG